MDQTLHPFAKYIAILARGKTKTRALDLAESTDAMEMILKGETLPEQVGAFLMLMRLKEETPEEIAGFTIGARSTFNLPNKIPKVDIDWSSYAGKRRQLPWFMFSIFLLAQNGIKVFLHGTEGHTPNRVYTSDVLKILNIEMAKDLKQAAKQIEKTNFTYVPLEVLSPKLRELIDMRPILGLRSPVHSFSRMLNPFNAPLMMQGIFHRGFVEIHTGAAMILKQEKMAVFRGEGGEIEFRPNKPNVVYSTFSDEKEEKESWNALLPNPQQEVDEDMNIADMSDLWSGKKDNEYGKAATIGTLAIALKALGKSENKDEAIELATKMWEGRDKSSFLKV